MANVVDFPGTERSQTRYTTVAIVLHWTIAVLLVLQIIGGWVAEDVLKGAAKFQAFQIHKSMGLTILLLTFARLAWRLGHKPPPPPAGMPDWQKAAASAVHVGFYVLLIAIPLSGLVLISSSSYVVKTMWWGLVQVPELPLRGLENSKAIHDAAGNAHSLLVWGTIVLWALHVGAALKHQFVDRDGVLGRMLPFLK